jgi:F0F1-type ATP synthase membrane subunit b/b'
MANEKSSKSRNDSDSAKTGNSCGFSLGCLILVIAAAVIIFFLFIKPALEDAGYSTDDIKDKVLDLKEKAGDAIDRSKEIYQDGKDKYEDAKTEAEDAVDKGREIYQDGEDKLEDIKDKTGKQVNDIKESMPEELEKSNKAAPKLIEDN